MNTKNLKYLFSYGLLAFEFFFFFVERLWMSPFHTLQFTLPLTMMAPCFVTSDDSVYEGIKIITIAILVVGRCTSVFMQQ
jgi:hypothetical protein